MRTYKQLKQLLQVLLVSLLSLPFASDVLAQDAPEDPPTLYWSYGNNYPPLFRTPLEACSIYPRLDIRATRISDDTYFCDGLVFLDPPENKRPERFGFAFSYGISCDAGEKYFDDVKNCVPVPELPSDPPKDSGPNCSADAAKSQPVCGQPINPGNGNMWHIERDYVGTGANGLSIVRTYNSFPPAWDVKAISGFGARWAQPYYAVLKPTSVSRSSNSAIVEICWQREDTGAIWCESSLSAPTAIPQAISIIRGDGKKYIFVRNGQAWVSDADVNDRVIASYTADGSAITGWTYISGLNDSVERYGVNGVLLSISARGSATQRLTYSTGTTNDSSAGRFPEDAPVCAHVQNGGALPAGKLLCVTDDGGRQLHFEYDGKGRISKMIDPAQQEYLYAYDGPSGGCVDSNDSNNPACSANNLTQVTYPDGKSRVYHYNEAALINRGYICEERELRDGDIFTDEGFIIEQGYGALPNHLTGLVDENGARHITWTYYCGGEATSSEVAGTEKVELDYSYLKETTVKYYVGTPDDPQIARHEYKYQNVLGVLKNIDIDQPCVECGPIKSRTYDANGNVASTTDWRGNQTTYAYDLTRNLEASRVEAVGTAKARTITTQWHETYRLPVKIAQPNRITNFVYDNAGNLVTKSIQATNDATGTQAFAATLTGSPRVWNYTYNNVGQMLTAADPLNNVTSYAYDSQGNLATVTNAIGHVTTLSNYDANGLPGKITDPNGLVTNLAYSSRGWLTSRDIGGQITYYDYDGVGQLTKVTQPDGATLSYTYDDAHRLTDITDSVGNRIHYKLDLRGNRIEEQTTDPTGVLARKISREYDTLNRLKKITGGQQ